MRQLRKKITHFLLYFLLLNSIFFIKSEIVFATQLVSSDICADGAILMDANSGKILFGKNINTSYPPASTTKIMTALLTLENCKLDEEVTISKKCEREIDGSKIYMFEGEKVKVKDLLHALILASANDCALALAEHISGSEKSFAELMNKRAKELGCTNTNFANPHGLYNDKHKTTAHDLAMIMKELINHKEYVKISQTPAYKMPTTNKCKEKRPLWNGNKLIHQKSSYYYKNCLAGKTGYTTESLHSYICSAKKNDQTLIVALIHDKQKLFYKDSVKLFNYGFENFQCKKLISKDEQLYTYNLNENQSIPLISDRDLYICTNKNFNTNNSFKLPTLQLDNLNLKEKNFKKGDIITNIKINYNMKDYDLKLLSGINHNSENSILPNSINFFKKHILKFFMYLLIVILILFILLTIISNLRIRKKRTKRKNQNKKI